MSKLICVCICTYRRPGLERTLKSLAEQRLPDGVGLQVVVVDNDAEGSARGMVEAFKAQAAFPVSYAVEPKKGLSSVRNRTLAMANGDWVALIDDDEAATPQWVAELLGCAELYGADAVIGERHATFDVPPPSWILASGFFEGALPPTGTRLSANESTSANALLRTAFLKRHGLRFDEQFNTTGGEDTDFFQRVLDAGGVMVSSREASVRDFVPSERASREYLMRRSLSVGETYARVTHRHGGLKSVLGGVPRAVANILGAAALTAVSLPWGSQAYARYLLALMRNLGKLRYYLKISPIEMYK
jgi:succinoglycan biosynthesis protein ExoM